MSIEWSRLREFDGSVPNAFEELCAQIARIECAMQGWQFVRNGKPDGGLECFARKDSNALIGWQAKWYPNAPTDKQWNDIKQSFQDALANYPELDVFVVCLPLDRGNGRGKRKLVMDKWLSFTSQCITYATNHGRSVTLEYRGTSELFEVLSRRDQTGRLRYWLQRESFDPEWFRRQFQESWANNRRRYRPDIHVELPSDAWAHALCQTKTYVDQLRQLAGDVTIAIHALERWKAFDSTRDTIAFYGRAGEELEQLLLALPQAAESTLPYEGLRVIWRKIRDEMQKPSCAAPLGLKRDVASDWERALLQLDHATRELYEFTDEALSQVNEARAVLILGDAGQGKTHALFRIADERTRVGAPVIVLAGIAFSTGDPWLQMIGSLGLKCDRDEFLGAMNASGEAKQTRALIIIDALNESDDPGLWKRSIAGMLEVLRGFPFVALAVSLRGEYAEAVLPDGLSDDELPRITHHGFAGHEAAAAAGIFDHFGIQAPDIPLLDPEFSNPLFVVTLAEGLQRDGRTTIPPVAQSLRWVFDLWLDGVNRKLSQPSELDYDVAERRVQAVAQALAQAMADRGSKWLTVTDAKTIVSSIHASASFSTSMFRALVSEDVIQRLQVYEYATHTLSDRIRFTFDRFADHHVVRALLSRYGSVDALRDAIGQAGDDDASQASCLHLDAGLLRALAIELPEDSRFRCELGNILTGADYSAQVRRAVLDSIQWRSIESIGNAVVDLVRKDWMAQRTQSLAAQAAYVNRLVQLSMRAGHPLNADFIDAELRAVPMGDRDYWWSRPLTTLDEPHGIVMRLIDWFHTLKCRTVDEETARLASVILFWLFPTSNRFIRDRATKAAVAVLTPYPRLASMLVEQFLTIDDPYIVERGLAAAYGVALRTNDNAGLATLASMIYTRCSVDSQLPVHLTSRCYASEIVDAAARRGLVPGEWALRTKPPYASDWPPAISTREDWNHLREGEWNCGLRAIWRSVFDDDFSRYVIEHGLNRWLRYRHADVLPPELTSPDTILSRAADWEIIEADRSRAKARGTAPYSPPYAHPDGPLPPCTTPSGRRLTPTEVEWAASFPSEQARCMVMDEVMRLGYSSRLDEGVESRGLHGEHVGRIGTKAERMGKKYQWIAYWTTQARIADRFRFRDGHRISVDDRFEGSWQVPRSRDIDPTCLLRQTAGGGWTTSPTWWAPFSRTEFERSCDDQTWLRDTARVPTLQDICGIVEPGSKRRWIVGWAFVKLDRQKPVGRVSMDWRRRSLWYYVQTVLVRDRDVSRLVRWLNMQRVAPGDNGHNLLPERPHMHRCFLREYPNSAAWSFENNAYQHREAWSEEEWTQSPVPCSVIADGYFDDDDMDGSRDETLQFALPSAELFHGLGLRHTEQDGHFVNASGRLVAWDPSVTQEGPMALLLDSEAMLTWAKERSYRLITFVHGEQTAVADRIRSDEYLGSLLFSGVFTHNGARWTGSADARFHAPMW